jgi:predicted DNA-binding transcriptional regulator AlpA
MAVTPSKSPVPAGLISHESNVRVLALSPRLRAKDVALLLAISKSTLYKWISEERFPKPDGNDGKRIVWWRAETVKKYL